MYSSYNWNVLGAAMEAAANQDFLGYIEGNVINPLKLSNTIPDTGRKNSQATQFYEFNGQGGRFITPPVNFSHAWPCGGYLSTAEDMAAFGSAHLRPGFLKSESLRLLFTPHKTSDGKPTPYGIGWFGREGRLASRRRFRRRDCRCAAGSLFANRRCDWQQRWP
ncbi:MAG: serine hydrolase domain-containing protein, partial [Limisphaerales bacterium]